MNHILIVEDDPRICDLLRDYFSAEYAVSTAQTGADALIAFHAQSFQLVILDVMLPVLDGWEVCKAIRQISQTPIIMLTAKSDEASNLLGFELGVDDYVTKPFSPKILLAKAKAVLKRHGHAMAEPTSAIEISDRLIIDEKAHKVVSGNREVLLSSTEFSILLLLAKRAGSVLSRDEILDEVWGENYFGDPRIVDTNIKRIREKLQDDAEAIKTVRGVGYRMEKKESW